MNASLGPPSGRRVAAILGPTNTGKTHLAVERMLGHSTGIIGLPLRLLAREVYDRIVAIRGPRAVALITGEERIVPPAPSYLVCTVEAMPLDRRFAFLAVDEVQLATDAERGHIFTDRLLCARGIEETMFLGSRTVERHVRRLVPRAEITTRPRFSKLTYAGTCKLRRLPPRTAIVAFSVADVYAIAEQVRRQRGGAAVVLGALSPRSRNAQVRMFEAGEVDYIVATDAIGMGLNLDLDHVAFAGTRKFDGRFVRDLDAAELGQIAGRAGRYTNDGAFGVTADIPPLDPELVERIEQHRFEPQKSIFYRNTDLDYSSLPALLRSLDEPAPEQGLVRAREADDQRALKALAATPSIAGSARGPAALRLLWDVCRIPDFRKTMAEAHARLLGRIFAHLIGPSAQLPTDWVATHVARLDRTEGDIDTLAARIAHVRTWAYVSHRTAWLDDAHGWQQRIRSLEDRLSDALHQRLTQRFVDRRSAALTKRLKDKAELLVAVEAEGEVLVEGHSVGRLEGLRFRPDSGVGTGARALRAAANRAIPREISGRAAQLSLAPDEALALDGDGQTIWQAVPIARLTRGRSLLQPGLRLLPGDLPPGTERERVRRRLVQWLEDHLRRLLAPLHELAAADHRGTTRGLVFQLQESLGSLPRHAVKLQLRSLDRGARAQLRRRGLRFGETSIFLPAMVKPERIEIRWLLWSVHAGADRHAAPPPAGLVSVEADPDVALAHYEAAGYRVCGSHAVRVDMLERLAGELRRIERAGERADDRRLLSWLGCSREGFIDVLASLGYEHQAEAGEPIRRLSRRGRRPNRRGRPETAFSALGERLNGGPQTAGAK